MTPLFYVSLFYTVPLIDAEQGRYDITAITPGNNNNNNENNDKKNMIITMCQGLSLVISRIYVLMCCCIINII